MKPKTRAIFAQNVRHGKKVRPNYIPTNQFLMPNCGVIERSSLNWQGEIDATDTLAIELYTTPFWGIMDRLDSIAQFARIHGFIELYFADNPNCWYGYFVQTRGRLIKVEPHEEGAAMISEEKSSLIEIKQTTEIIEGELTTVTVSDGNVPICYLVGTTKIPTGNDRKDFEDLLAILQNPQN